MPTNEQPTTPSLHDELRKAVQDFCTAVNREEWNTELRTLAEDIVILADQVAPPPHDPDAQDLPFAIDKPFPVAEVRELLERITTHGKGVDSLGDACAMANRALAVIRRHETPTT